MKKSTLLTIVLFTLSASSIGAWGGGFAKRWFWFYSGKNEVSYVVITYDPENSGNNAIEGEGITSSDEQNPFSAFFNGYWYDVFNCAENIVKSGIQNYCSLTIPMNDPIFKHTIKEPTVFKASSSGSSKIRRLEKYHKVVFKSENGSTIVIFFEKLNDLEYRVSAIFMNSAAGEKYSYRDFNFRKDYGDDGSSGASTAINFFALNPNSHNKVCLGKLNDIVKITDKNITNLSEFIFKPVFYIYTLKSF